MRILQVLHDFIDTNPFGTELYTYYLSRQLSKDHRVAILYYENDKEREVGVRQSSHEGIVTFVINLPVPDLGDWSLFRYSYRPADRLFAKVLSLFDPHVVHFQHLLYSSMNFPSLAKASGCATLHTLHDFYLICPKFKLIDNNLARCEKVEPVRCLSCCLKAYSRKNLIRRVLQENNARRLLYHLFLKRPIMVRRKVFRDVDLFISPSRFLRDKFTEHGLPAERIIHSDNGMNLEFAKGNGGPKCPRNPMVFGYIGSHHVDKGVPLLIEAFNGIENGRLLLYGPEAGKTYRKRATNPDIRFEGVIDDARKREVFAGLDVLVVPSIWFENSPLTIHEAFMFHTPVITSDRGGMAELVQDGVSGLHFAIGDVGDLRKKIRFCIENPARVREMAEKVPAVKSIDENAREVEEVYLRILRKREFRC